MTSVTRAPRAHAAGRSSGGRSRDGRSAPAPAAARQRIGRWRGVTLAQLVAIELAAALALIPVGRQRWLLFVCAPLAAAVLALTLARRRGRWLFEWVGVRRAAQRRRAQAQTPAGAVADPGFAAVLECHPGLWTTSVTDRRRNTIGMVGDGSFLTAILLVEGDGEPLRQPPQAQPLPLSALATALRADDVTLASVQVVQHTQPAPATHLSERALAARSYLALTEASVPAARLTWVALKLEPDRCPLAIDARGGGTLGAERALLKAAHQLQADLAVAGFRATPLTESELTTALATSASVNPLVGSHGAQQHLARRTRETHRAWRCDDRWHLTYWASRWPRLAGAGSVDVVGLLTGTPALASTFSITLVEQAPGSYALGAHVRVATRSERDLAEASRQLEARGRQAGLGLVRLDGEHLPGVLATLPLGGALAVGLA